MSLKDRVSSYLQRTEPELDGMEEIYPLSYAIPDELIVSKVPEKTSIWAEVIPGFPETYRFGPEQQSEYYQQYRNSRFAFTWKKGGWDCLRHYEILANGCIPVFRDLDMCPEYTITSFPKQILRDSIHMLLPWQEKNAAAYTDYATKLLDHTHEHMSCSAIAKYFLQKMNLSADGSKLLVLTCHPATNYSRETLLVGLKRMVECVEFPKLAYLYDDFPTHELTHFVGSGYTYGRRLKASQTEWTVESILRSIRAHEWNAVVYGRMGEDEEFEGSVPNCPFWSEVSEIYSRNEIAFIYGGDAPQDRCNLGSAHTTHLLNHAKLGRCFVRELI